ncbi:MAG: hypothetical protein IJN90_04520 [Bacilli bacterium]|nr:hypothetical protein [Bacilli bacterium]
MKKDEYIKYAKETFKSKALDIVLRQIDLYYEKEDINKKQYEVGEEVILKKGTHLHGIPGYMENFDWTVENGFIGNDFTTKSTPNKIKNSIGMWDIKEDCKLIDYIKKYSGFTITYTIGRGPGSKEITELIPYHKFDEYTENINNQEDIWMYWGDQTKEIRFMPSLVANKRQIAFILNMDSDAAKEMYQNDVWNIDLDDESLREFVDYRYYDKFLVERKNKTALTTDRETAIIFGLPPRLIEGVFVGRKLEKDMESLKYIKDKLPDCYICNLDGKVIIGNK